MTSPLLPMLAALRVTAHSASSLPAPVQRLVDLAEPWKSVYGDSKVLPTLIVFLHLSAMLIGGGLALATDRATLRVHASDGAARRQHLAELASTHRTVLGAIVVLFVTGLLLFLSDVETFVVAWQFYVKIGLVLLLLVNGFVMTRAESSLRAAEGEAAFGAEQMWRRLRTVALSSAALWLATLLAGVALTNA